MASQSNSPVTNITGAGELDTILVRFDGYWSNINQLRSEMEVNNNIPDSESAMRSTQILLNSVDGIEIVAAYSVSGIPKCS